MQDTSVSPNSLSPDIYIQILQTDPYTFTLRIGWENLLKDEPSIFALVIILLILMIFLLMIIVSIDIIRRKLALITLGT